MACCLIDQLGCLLGPLDTRNPSLTDHHYSLLTTFQVAQSIMSTEKAQEYHLESALPEGNRSIHVDPAVEKRVIRKLDWNFVPLVVALCKCSILPQDMKGRYKKGKAHVARSGLLLRPIKHRERRDSGHEQGSPRNRRPVSMALDHLLHPVYPLRVDGADVENRAPTHLDFRNGFCLV